MRAFGLGKQTTVEWPYQPAGLLIPPTQYYSTGKYSTAIGYGVAVTAMQMVDAFATIANDGVTQPPHLLDATIDAKGVRHPAAVPEGTRVVSDNTAAVMIPPVKSRNSTATSAEPRSDDLRCTLTLLCSLRVKHTLLITHLRRRWHRLPASW
jgi:cell division protein FtsI (penicillin-binding protein 3)